MSNDFNNFKVNIDYSKSDFDDIVSDSSKKDSFEDIFSSTKEKTDIISSGSKHSKPSKRQDRWNKKSKGQKRAYFIFLIVAAVLFLSFVTLAVITLLTVNLLTLSLTFFNLAALMVMAFYALDYKYIVWIIKKKKWAKTLHSFLFSVIALLEVAVLAITIFAGMYTLNFAMSYNHNEITNDPEDLGFEEVIDKEIVNVALFGIDTRNPNTFSGNSDSIMVLSLNTKTQKVKITSIVRDTFVPIENNGRTKYSKINSAYATGGPELAIKTINESFGLDISEYATVNFYGMVDIIDAVGGIDAELTQAEVKRPDGTLHHINGCIDEICANLGKSPKSYYITTAGKHHLNGIQAVAYSRIRYVRNIWGTNNDYGRTDRQRHVMEQLFNKALNISKGRYPKLIESLLPCSETSLSPKQILALANAIFMNTPTFEQTRLPNEKYLMPSPQTSAGSVVYYDLDFAKDLMHAFIYEDISFDDYVAQNGIRKNDWYSKLR